MKMVFTNGCFDVLHEGHVKLLQECRRLAEGGRVVVGLNSDISVKLLKGPSRPLNRQNDRKLILETLRCVDEVIIFDETTPERLLSTLNPDIIVKGGDYTAETVIGKQYAKEIVIFPYIEGISSSATIAAMKYVSTQPNVLVIGDSCKDVYHFGVCERLSPEAPVPVLREKRIESRPGMCMNVVLNLHGLGAHVNVVTQAKSIEKHRFVDDRRSQHLLRVDIEDCPVDEIDVPKFWNDHIQDKEYDAVVISDYNKGFLGGPGTIGKLVDMLHNMSPYVFVDTKRTDVSCFPNCILKINKQEWDAITAYPLEETGAEFIVTLGAEGAMWRNKVYPTRKVQMHDVCGAGDTFLAALVYEYVRSKDMERAIGFANACASEAVTHFGNHVIEQKG